MVEHLSLCLKPTYYIDHGSPSVSRISREIAASHPGEPATAIFNFVRDNITYNPYSPFYLPEHYPASKTLERGEGFCVQKAVLLAARARALGIPSRLVFADIRNHLVPEKRWAMMKTDLFVFHGYNELFADLPFERLMHGFRRAYTPQMLRRWKDASLERRKG